MFIMRRDERNEAHIEGEIHLSNIFLLHFTVVSRSFYVRSACPAKTHVILLRLWICEVGHLVEILLCDWMNSCWYPCCFTSLFIWVGFQTLWTKESFHKKVYLTIISFLEGHPFYTNLVTTKRMTRWCSYRGICDIVIWSVQNDI